MSLTKQKSTPPTIQHATQIMTVFSAAVKNAVVIWNVLVHVFLNITYPMKKKTVSRISTMTNVTAMC